jgi:hypothetical protein
MEQFSIVFTARTGSSYLQTALKNHPHVACLDEDRLVNAMYANKGHVAKGEDIHPQLSGNKKFSGIKVVILQNLYEFDHDFWATNVWDRPMIICTRNPLHSFISFRLVKENNEAWNKLEYQNPVTIDVDDAKEWIAGLKYLLQPFLDRPESKLVLHYEEGVEEMYRKSLYFLGIDYRKPVTSFTKQATRPLEELVTNYDELAQSELGYLLK